MASIDEELLLDEEDDRRERAFIREQLPQELKEKYSDEQLQWMLDTIVSYYCESGILEDTIDDDEVDIDLEQVAQYVCQQATADGMAPLDAQEVRFVVEADLDYQEQNL